MNKLIINNDELINKEVSNNIDIDFTSKSLLFDVNSMEITFHESASLVLVESSNINYKLNIKFNVDPNIKVNIIEYRTGSTCKLGITYNIYESSNVIVSKFYNAYGSREQDNIFLLGNNANIDYVFKDIATGSEKFDIHVFHKYKNTNSNIVNNAVNIKNGNVIFNVSSFVNEGNIGCKVNQSSKIINLTLNKCQINPNLFIDEEDVCASHSAHIGAFDEDKIFYLRSRGIPLKDASRLLLEGFLTDNINKWLTDKITDSINEYWG